MKKKIFMVTYPSRSVKDVKDHLEVFDPDVIVYFVSNQYENQYFVITSLDLQVLSRISNISGVADITHDINTLNGYISSEDNS